MSTGSFKSEANSSGPVWGHHSFSFLTIAADLYPANAVVMVLIHIPDKT